jgi:hypothetical protein
MLQLSYISEVRFAQLAWGYSTRSRKGSRPTLREAKKWRTILQKDKDYQAMRSRERGLARIIEFQAATQ